MIYIGRGVDSRIDVFLYQPGTREKIVPSKANVFAIKSDRILGDLFIQLVSHIHAKLGNVHIAARNLELRSFPLTVSPYKLVGEQ